MNLAPLTGEAGWDMWIKPIRAVGYQMVSLEIGWGGLTLVGHPTNIKYVHMLYGIGHHMFRF